jgi:hypothetical protein
MQCRQVQTQISGLVEQPHYILLLIVEIQKLSSAYLKLEVTRMPLIM